jgi:hypothetical protein
MNIPRFTAAASLSANAGYSDAISDTPAPASGVIPALVGRWELSSRCQFACIEVCTRFCRPTGWACCQWETRCALSCDGITILSF